MISIRFLFCFEIPLYDSLTPEENFAQSLTKVLNLANEQQLVSLVEIVVEILIKISFESMESTRETLKAFLHVSILMHKFDVL